MRDQPVGGGDVPEPDAVTGVVLEVLLARYPALVAMEELVRDLGEGDGRRGLPRVFIEDGVAELLRDGLAHRLERFVFASHSAVRAAAVSR